MSGYQVDVLVLLVGGLGPALLLASQGSPSSRLIALELATAVATALFLLIAQVASLSFDLILPLAFVPLSFAGTLVFTRLLSSRRDD